MTAKEMFEKLGYEYSYYEGFIEYVKGEPIPDRINTIYVKFTKISFNKLEKEMAIYDYNKDALCLNYIPKKSTNGCFVFTNKELQAINKQVEELGWLTDTIKIDPIIISGEQFIDNIKRINDAYPTIKKKEKNCL